jgi:hypothetical protein
MFAGYIQHANIKIHREDVDLFWKTAETLIVQGGCTVLVISDEQIVPLF